MCAECDSFVHDDSKELWVGIVVYGLAVHLEVVLFCGLVRASEDAVAGLGDVHFEPVLAQPLLQLFDVLVDLGEQRAVRSVCEIHCKVISVECGVAH